MPPKRRGSSMGRRTTSLSPRGRFESGSPTVTSTDTTSEMQTALLTELRHIQSGAAKPLLDIPKLDLQDGEGDAAEAVASLSSSPATANATTLEEALAFDTMEEFDFKTSEDHVMEINSNVVIPSPYSSQTKTRTRVAQASFIVEKLHQEHFVYDERVFMLCRKYHQLHRNRHEELKKKHRTELEVRQMSDMDRRDRWNYVFDQPQATRTGRILALIEFLLILITLVQLNIETLPRYNPEVIPEMENVWFVMELTITVFFTLESVARLLLARDRIGWISSPLNIMDIVAVLPFYLSLFASGSAFDFLKVLRMARFVKLFRSFRHIDALVVTLTKIYASLVAPVAFLIVCVLIIANLVFYAEGGDLVRMPDDLFFNRTSHFCPATVALNATPSTPLFVKNASAIGGAAAAARVLAAINASCGNVTSSSSSSSVTLTLAEANAVALRALNETERRALPFDKFLIEDCDCTSSAAYHLGMRECPQRESKFVSSLQTMWFSIISMTTVGYGDFTVECGIGRGIMSIGLFLSTVFLAMPIAIVGNSFTETVQERRQSELRKKQATAQNIRRMRLDEANTKELQDRAAAEAKENGNNNSGRNTSVKASGSRRSGRRKRRNTNANDSDDDGDGTNNPRKSSLQQNLFDVAAKIEQKLRAQVETTTNFIMNAGVTDRDVRTVRKRVARRQLISTEAVTSTAGEALLSHLAAALQQRYFSFSDFAMAKSRSDALAGVKANAERNMAEKEKGASATVEATPAAAAAGIAHPPAAIRRGLPAEVVHHIDTFVAWLLERWVSEWIQAQTKDLSNPSKLQQLRSASTSGSPTGGVNRNKRSTSSASVASEAALISDAITQQLARFRGLLETLQPIQWFNKLQAVENLRGFASEIQISRLITYEVVAVPQHEGGGSSGLAAQRKLGGLQQQQQQLQPDDAGVDNGLDGGDNSTSAVATNALSVSRGPLPHLRSTTVNTINLYCRDFVLPQRIARIEIHCGFAKRTIRLIPLCPTACSIHVNGEPLHKVAAAQGTGGVAPNVAMGGASWIADAMVASEAQPHPVLDERHMSVVLQEGDEINFTPIIRLRSDYDTRHNLRGGGVDASSDALRSRAFSRLVSAPVSEDAVAEQLRSDWQQRLEDLRRLGFDEIVYRVKAATPLQSGSGSSGAAAFVAPAGSHDVSVSSASSSMMGGPRDDGGAAIASLRRQIRRKPGSLI